MHSQIANLKHNNMVKLSQQMSPEERLTAFFNHSQLIAQIYQSGINQNKQISQHISQTKKYEKYF